MSPAAGRTPMATLTLKEPNTSVIRTFIRVLTAHGTPHLYIQMDKARGLAMTIPTGIVIVTSPLAT